MSKYSNEFKLMVVKEWLAGVMGKHTLAKKSKVSSPALLTRWRDEYEITGSIGSTHQKTYSPEFKLTVLNYLETHSQYETSRHFAVFPSTTIANWLETEYVLLFRSSSVQHVIRQQNSRRNPSD